jgi:geranylgeranylglycerol-phosphate geranylgeranyltransferase
VKFPSYLTIIRPFNVLFVAVCVLFGSFWFAEEKAVLASLLAALSATLIAAGGYVLNDYFDREIDKINRPTRAIPSGNISADAGKRYATILFIAGIFISLILRHPGMILLALFNTFLLYLYARQGKRFGIWGNFLVSFVAASTLLYGGMANNNLKNALFGFGVAFFYTMIRELIKDIEDVEGDRLYHAQTLPIKAGEKATIILAFAFWGFLTILILGGAYLFFGISTVVLILLLVNGYLLVNLVYLEIKMSRKSASLTEKIMKADMVVLLILLWMGQYGIAA